MAIPGNLRDPAFCARLVADAGQKLGGLDIVVSNAGRQQSHLSILDISDEDFDATIKTNIYAPFYIIKAALAHLSDVQLAASVGNFTTGIIYGAGGGQGQP